MSKKTPDQPDTPQDTVDTVVQPVATPPTGQPVAPPYAGPGAAAPAAPAPPEAVAPHPPRNRFAWVSSPKVAAATVITVLALSSLGGAFALGRATAGPDEHDRILIRAGFDGGERFGAGPGFRGPELGGREFGGREFGGPALQAPGQVPDQAPVAPQQGDTGAG